MMEQVIQGVEFARRYKRMTDIEREELLTCDEKLAQTLGPRYGPLA